MKTNTSFQFLIALLLVALTILTSAASCDDKPRTYDCTNNPVADCNCGSDFEHVTCPE